MSHSSRVAYVSYEEAQKLIPVFRYYAEQGPYKEAKADARVILKELGSVRPQNYDPLGGMQMFLTENQCQFLTDVRGEVE